MTEQMIVRYKASDGSDVELSPQVVVRHIVTGGQQVDEREVMAFIAKCQARRLNPLAGDAYMTAYQNRRTGKVETSVIVSKDYFIRTATQQPGFDGIRAGVVVASKRTGQLTYREGSIVGGKSESLVGGWAEVYDKGRSHPSRAEVSLAEYDQHKSLWTSKPATMIRKVALVQALREAYPVAYGGLYDSAEMPDGDVAVSVAHQQAPDATSQVDGDRPADASPPATPSEADRERLASDTASLVALGYREDEVRAWLWARYKEGGMDAVAVAVASMRELAGDSAQDEQDDQAVEPDLYDEDVDF